MSLLNIVFKEHWPLHQLDIQNAYLYGNLQEEVYMKIIPVAHSQKGIHHLACRLQKSIYA